MLAPATLAALPSTRAIPNRDVFYVTSPNGPQAAAQNHTTVVISPQAAAKLPTDDLTKVQQLAAQIPWFHHVILMGKVKDLSDRLWYVQSSRPRQMEVAALN